MSHLFTNRFKVGDEVVVIRNNPCYPTSHLKEGDIGIVGKIWCDGYMVHKKDGSKGEWAFKRECYIDFADINKRKPLKTLYKKRDRTTQRKDKTELNVLDVPPEQKIIIQKESRLQLIKKIYNKKRKFGRGCL